MAACLKEGRECGLLGQQSMPPRAPWQADFQCILYFNYITQRSKSYKYTVPNFGGNGDQPTYMENPSLLISTWSPKESFVSPSLYKKGSEPISLISWGGLSQVVMNFVLFRSPRRKSKDFEFPKTDCGRKRLRNGLKKIKKMRGDFNEPWCPVCSSKLN